MQASELNMVLSNWKRDLYVCNAPWRSRMRGEDFWDLVNFVIDKLTVPSCQIFIAVHIDEPTVPIAWIATRDRTAVYLYAVGSLRKDPELAAALQRELLKLAPVDGDQWYPHFSPYKELAR
jgi:hypothetical protein